MVILLTKYHRFAHQIYMRRDYPIIIECSTQLQEKIISPSDLTNGTPHPSKNQSRRRP